MHSRGAKGGVSRHIWGGVISRHGRCLVFFLVGGLRGLVRAGVLLVRGLGLDICDRRKDFEVLRDQRLLAVINVGLHVGYLLGNYLNGRLVVRE